MALTVEPALLDALEAQVKHDPMELAGADDDFLRSVCGSQSKLRLAMHQEQEVLHTQHRCCKKLGDGIKAMYLPVGKDITHHNSNLDAMATNLQSLRPDAQCTSAISAFSAMTREMLSLRQDLNNKLRKIHDDRLPHILEGASPSDMHHSFEKAASSLEAMRGKAAKKHKPEVLDGELTKLGASVHLGKQQTGLAACRYIKTAVGVREKRELMLTEALLAAYEAQLEYFQAATNALTAMMPDADELRDEIVEVSQVLDAHSEEAIQLEDQYTTAVAAAESRLKQVTENENAAKKGKSRSKAGSKTNIVSTPMPAKDPQPSSPATSRSLPDADSDQTRSPAPQRRAPPPPSHSAPRLPPTRTEYADSSDDEEEQAYRQKLASSRVEDHQPNPKPKPPRKHRSQDAITTPQARPRPQPRPRAQTADPTAGHTPIQPAPRARTQTSATSATSERPQPTPRPKPRPKPRKTEPNVQKNAGDGMASTYTVRLDCSHDKVWQSWDATEAEVLLAYGLNLENGPPVRITSVIPGSVAAEHDIEGASIDKVNELDVSAAVKAFVVALLQQSVGRCSLTITMH
eukprot:TRINITY_DN4377_c0_g1_i1.p1 TRINITY_DN4377_c0_g1~~TRINITY_DN4377_c0_g1_i1.p1  ORF type:complete len:574 (+),score=94.38 TRINITY_DN4377_c0_g1_i1:2-1723(+)